MFPAQKGITLEAFPIVFPKVVDFIACLKMTEYMCCMCGEAFAAELVTTAQKADCITGSKNQFRCNKCNALRLRVQRMVKSHDEELGGYTEFNPEERRTFYKKAQHLCGAELNKVLTETIQQSTIRRMTEVLSMQGEFVEISDIKEHWAKKPTMLDNLLTFRPG